MAGRLPDDLVTEAKSTLDNVGRIKLPPYAWSPVWQRLVGVDAAVRAGDPAALRAALDDLHRMGVDARRNPADSWSSGAPTNPSAPQPPPQAFGSPAQPSPPGWFSPAGVRAAPCRAGWGSTLCIRPVYPLPRRPQSRNRQPQRPTRTRRARYRCADSWPRCPHTRARVPDAVDHCPGRTLRGR